MNYLEFKNRIFKTKSCWYLKRLRTGKPAFTGRPRFSYNRKRRPATHWAFEIFCGPIPQGKIVCHTCDNPACIHPSHLWLGSQSDNIQDAVRKGRWIQAGPNKDMRGKNHWNYKHGRRVGKCRH